MTAAAVRVDVAGVAERLVEAGQRFVGVAAVLADVVAPRLRRFPCDCVSFAWSRALPIAGSRMPISNAMIETTTSNSMMVKAVRRCMSRLLQVRRGQRTA
jgi:hypothetical protein